jgi:hypothetical protein
MFVLHCRYRITAAAAEFLVPRKRESERSRGGESKFPFQGICADELQKKFIFV